MDDTQINLRAIFGLLQRQFRLILIVLISALALATIAAFALTPIYTSSALIMVDPSAKNLLEPETGMTSASSDSARIDSEVELVRSDNVLLKVIQEQNLTSDSEFGVTLGTTARILQFLRLREPQLPSGEAALNEALSTLRNAVTVQRRALTYLISVQVRSESPQKAADLANSLTRVYIADQLASKVNSALASRDTLQARLSQARELIVSSEGSFDSFIAQNIDRITQDTGRNDLAQMQAQLDQLLAARQQTAALADSARALLDQGDLDGIVASLQSDALLELERQRDEMTANLAAAEAGSPLAVNLRQELAAIEGRLRNTASSEINALRDTVQADQAQEDSLRQDLRSQVLTSELSGDVLAQLYELQQNAQIARTQYQTLLARTQDLEAQATLQLADSRIVSPALAPQSPSFPNKTLIVLVSGLIGIGLGIALAFLYENLIGGFTSEEQVASVLKTPVAATVPRERSKTENASLANLMVTAPLSIYAESVRRARAAVDHAMRKRGETPSEAAAQGKVVMLTSTAPNEGKTTLALSLARSYALSGHSVLLIDCDMRKPSIHRHIGAEPSKGLLQFLSSDSMTDISGIVQKDELTDVTIVVGARRSDLPTDQLIAGRAFSSLIRSARQSFDVVVLDTPPIGPVVDGLYIAAHADAILFITRWASTSQLDARKSVAALENAKGPDCQIIAVLNERDASAASYQRKYGGYYSYTTG
ncbi:GumC family protein [Devosia chinhatensis]|uniref:GumC family protein n=1 Tax=Devosia chinhatensis TaxID=429727 RepID=UPI000696DBCB|nr:Wzz/FepE/Etk N-terminal domain-containing protein [Devosia chinhatensis]